jgi:hypothetical protein
MDELQNKLSIFAKITTYFVAVGIAVFDTNTKQFKEGMKRKREKTQGITYPYDICQSTEGPNLYRVSSLSKENFYLLCQVNGCELSKSA